MTTTFTRYEDCDSCGERYHDEDIPAYLRDVERDGEVVTLCLSCPNDAEVD